MSADENQGEGNRAADRTYSEGAARFARSGEVEPAAAASRLALDGDEAQAMKDAERIGKDHIAEDDAHDAGPLPSFWTAHQESSWARVKAAMRRDWAQTRSHFGLGGAHLGQTVRDTVEQAVGAQPLPGEDTGVDWDLARHAIRLGYGAASFWVNDSQWGEPLEDRLRLEWTGMNTGLVFETAISLVRHGWEQGRKELTP